MAKKTNKPKKQTLAQDVAGMRQWQEDHGKHDDERHQQNIERFAEGTKKMDTLATHEGLARGLNDLARLFVETDDITGEAILDIKGRMIPRFAEKKDLERVEQAVAPVVTFYDKLALSAQIVDKTGQWLSSKTFWLAAFLVAVGVITGKLWVFMGMIASFFGGTTPK